MARKSFFSSVMDGVAGYVKGAIAAGAVGAVLGAVGGAIVGLATGGTGIIAAAAVGAVYTGSISAGLGAVAGIVTGVVKGREATQVSGQDVANVANIAFEHGVAIGEEHTLQNPSLAKEESRHFRAMIEKQRAAETTHHR